jgi:hypothetical protein
MPAYKACVNMPDRLVRWTQPEAYRIIVRMEERRLLTILISPSLISALLSFVFTALVKAGARWPYIHAHPVLATYVLGDYGLSSVFHRINILLGVAFNSSLAYNIAAVCFAILVGLSVYIVVAGYRYMLTEMQAIRDEIAFTKKVERRRVETVLGLRLGLRLASLAAWSLYSVFFFNIIIPYAITLTSTNIITDPLVLARWFGALLLLLATTHLHVIFARLLALRPRLLGSADTLLGRSRL